MRRCAKGIYEAPKANMYQACQNMNNTIMLSRTYDIVYVEGAVNNQVSMEWLRQNQYKVVLMEEQFYKSFDTSAAECKFDCCTSNCKNGVNPDPSNVFFISSTCSMGSSLAGQDAFFSAILALTNGGLVSLERKMRGFDSINITGPGNLVIRMMQDADNLAYNIRRDNLDLRCNITSLMIFVCWFVMPPHN